MRPATIVRLVGARKGVLAAAGTNALPALNIEMDTITLHILVDTDIFIVHNLRDR